MSRALDKALAEAKRAEADVAKWVGKVEAQRAALAQMEAAAGSALLDDPAAEARLPRELDAAASQLRAFERAATTAETRHREALRVVLLVEADEEDAAAATLEREAAKVAAAVDEVQRRLEELDGTSWERFERHAGVAYSNESLARVVATPRAEQLESQARAHRLRAGVARHVHTHGRVPTF